MEPGDDDNQIELDSEAQEVSDYMNWVREGFAKFRHLIPEHDALLLDMRFGLSEFDREHTLEEVGKAFDVTRERVRQIEQKTLAGIRYLSLDLQNFDRAD
mgnify:CR=1 FL=1